MLSVMYGLLKQQRHAGRRRPEVVGTRPNDRLAICQIEALAAR